MPSISEAQIKASLKALASGVNLDPPLLRQQELAQTDQLHKLRDLHLWLVVGIARKRIENEYGPQEAGVMPVQDELKAKLLSLCNSGLTGLEKALGKWDPGAGYKFGTYASWWIRQAISGAAV